MARYYVVKQKLKNMSRQQYKDIQAHPDKFSEPVRVYGSTNAVRQALVTRIMKIDKVETLQSIIEFLNNADKADNEFEKEWNRSLSVEEFKMRCNAKLKEIYE